jgi:hypothetical protein
VLLGLLFVVILETHLVHADLPGDVFGYIGLGAASST